MSEEKILIAYASKRGSAKQAAEWVAEELGPGCDLVDLKKNPSPNLEPYRVVVLGSGMVAGQLYKPLKKFIGRYSAELEERRVAVFITHIAEGEEIEQDFRSAFAEEFLNRACVRAGLGGRLQIDRLNFLVRMIMKKIEKESGRDYSNYDSLSREACFEFAHNVRQRCLG